VAWNETIIDVLTPQETLLASFVSALEACRYAALVCEPGYQPVLRRAADGALLRFDPRVRAQAVADWVAGGGLRQVGVANAR
jgi:hypothetical protein